MKFSWATVFLQLWSVQKYHEEVQNGHKVLGVRCEHNTIFFKWGKWSHDEVADYKYLQLSGALIAYRWSEISWQEIQSNSVWFCLSCLQGCGFELGSTVIWKWRFTLKMFEKYQAKLKGEKNSCRSFFFFFLFTSTWGKNDSLSKSS